MSAERVALAAPSAVAPLSVGRKEPVQPGLRLMESRVAGVSIWEDLVLFLVVFAAGSAIGVWAFMELHLFTAGSTDNLARTYLVVQVFHGFEPKLANLGFIWPPLPQLLQFPLVALFPELAYQGATGPLTSAFAAGVSLLFLNRILAPYLPRKRYRYLVLALYQTNPLIIYLTISGLSEIVFLMFVLIAWWSFQRLCFEEPLPYAQVAVMGAAAAGAVLSRYEGAVYAITLGALLVVVMYYQKRPRQWAVAEGLALASVIPWGYALALWVFANATIQGDATYFLTGRGSNADQMVAWYANHPSLQLLVGNPPASALYTLRAAWDVFPLLLLVVPPALVLAVARRDLFLFSMIVAAVCFPAIQWLLYLRGQSAGWLRYYAYDVVFGITLLTYCLRPRAFPLPRWIPRALVGLAALALIGWSNLMSWQGLEDPRMILADEIPYLRSLARGGEGVPRFVQWEIGRYFHDEIFAAHPDALVLADDQVAHNVILFSEHPGQFVVPNASRFPQFLNAPVGRVDFILVPEKTITVSSPIDERYPGIFEEGTPFTSLEKEFVEPDGWTWRIYRVKEA